MDVVSHGLWGGLAFGRKSKKLFGLALIFGALPDLIPFSFEFVRLLFGESFRLTHPDLGMIPSYVYMLYNHTHSLVVFGFIFLLTWAIIKKPFLPMAAWGLHILMDIPTHSLEFFPTPFLWPISDYKFNGMLWTSPAVFIPNIVALLVLYILWRKSRRLSKHSLTGIKD